MNSNARNNNIITYLQSQMGASAEILRPENQRWLFRKSGAGKDISLDLTSGSVGGKGKSLVPFDP